MDCLRDLSLEEDFFLFVDREKSEVIERLWRHDDV